jgi:hypothetical protein
MNKYNIVKTISNEPLVSIIIPVYNGSNYLAKAIDSSLNQTYNNIEVIIVDDGSTDDTKQICLTYGDKVRYFRKENGGTSSALNYGISKMNGEYFSWLSHDDLYHENKIQKQIEVLREIDFDKEYFVGTTANLVNATGNVIRRNKKKSTVYYSNEEVNDLVYKKNLNGCGLLIPKKMLVDIAGFDHRYKYMQDLVCWIRIINNGAKFIYLREDLVSSRIHEQQQTIKIRHLLDKEIELQINELMLDERVLKNDKKLLTLLKYSIRTKKVYLFKQNLEKYDIKFKPYVNIEMVFYRIYTYFYRIGKKIYWRIKRRV